MVIKMMYSLYGLFQHESDLLRVETCQFVADLRTVEGLLRGAVSVGVYPGVLHCGLIAELDAPRDTPVSLAKEMSATCYLHMLGK